MTWRCLPLPTADLELAGYACTYLGSCWECGGSVDAVTPGGIDGRWCDTDCADSYAANQTAVEARQQARRAADDAWGDEAHQLILEGHSYEQADAIMAQRHPDG